MGKLLYGARFRRNSSFTVSNSLFMGYPTGAIFESPGTIADISNFTYSLVHGYRSAISPAFTMPASVIRFPYNYFDCNTSVELISPFDLTDFSPVFGTFAYNSGKDGMYLGACNPTLAPWTSGWARLEYIY
jgi:hypothetical protein